VTIWNVGVGLGILILIWIFLVYIGKVEMLMLSNPRIAVVAATLTFVSVSFFASGGLIGAFLSVFYFIIAVLFWDMLVRELGSTIAKLMVVNFRRAKPKVHWGFNEVFAIFGFYLIPTASFWVITLLGLAMLGQLPDGIELAPVLIAVLASPLILTALEIHSWR